MRKSPTIHEQGTIDRYSTRVPPVEEHGELNLRTTQARCCNNSCPISSASPRRTTTSTQRYKEFWEGWRSYYYLPALLYRKQFISLAMRELVFCLPQRTRMTNQRTCQTFLHPSRSPRILWLRDYRVAIMDRQIESFKRGDADKQRNWGNGIYGEPYPRHQSCCSAIQLAVNAGAFLASTAAIPSDSRGYTATRKRLLCIRITASLHEVGMWVQADRLLARRHRLQPAHTHHRTAKAARNLTPNTAMRFGRNTPTALARSRLKRKPPGGEKHWVGGQHLRFIEE